MDEIALPVKFFLSISIILIVLWLLRRFFQGPKYTKPNRIDGKVVIITGSNTGIGRETALELAKRGGRIYMACRDMTKCEASRQEIVEMSNNQNVFSRELDLSSLESVRKFAHRFKEDESHLHILINNAGVMMCPKSQTVDGFETQIGVNHLGHFLLTNLLLDVLKASEPSRIVVVSSKAHIKSQINKDDLNSDKAYSKIGAYCQSKLANILFTKQLAKMLENTQVTVNACHPGVVKTELGRHMNKVFRCMLQPFTFVFFKTPVNGAQTQIRLALDPDLDRTTGKYFADCKEAAEAPQANDIEMAQWLWSESEKMVGLADRKMEAR